MTIFQSIILGIVQGFTEFFPISSSGHLIIVPHVFGWDEHSLAFDTILHLATAFTLMYFFRQDLLEILVSLFTDFKSKKLNFKLYSRNSMLGFMIALGCIPAALLGYFFDDYFETVFRDAGYAALFVFLGSLLLIFAEIINSNRNLQAQVISPKVGFKTSFIIGLFQSLALFPGMSRSGSTISGGMLLGLSREDAAKFSFLLSVPIVVMAAAFKIHSTDWALSGISLLVIVFGFLSAFFSGIFALNFLMKFLKKGSLKPFIIYRLILVGFLIFILL